MSTYKFPTEMRDVMLEVLPESNTNFGATPALQFTYLPPNHLKALDKNNPLVIGIRGSGKSFWFSALQDEQHRALVETQLPSSGITPNTKVSSGFGEKSAPDSYPGKDTFKQLLGTFNDDARLIWRTILLHQVTDYLGNDTGWKNQVWSARVAWVHKHPEQVERRLHEADLALDQEGKDHLLLFDGLDRTADDWPSMVTLMRGLLQILLECRSTRRIRAKAFVRPDHIEDPTTGAFPDASKVFAAKVELNWSRENLYGLLWQYLANASRGDLFREGCAALQVPQWQQHGAVWLQPLQLQRDEQLQRKVFHALTGPWMGRDHRRGLPYTWLPNHLGDGRRQVSPRSFLTALRRAAEDSDSRAQDKNSHAIHFESIKQGVQAASLIRVREMAEDYPWAEALMTPLQGLTVPCKFEVISELWTAAGVLTTLQREVENKGVKLPPTRLDRGHEGLRQDLENLGIFESMQDGRINLPDVYRIGFDLGRKGGVRRVARG